MQKDAEIASASLHLRYRMGERLQLFPQDGVAGGQAEGLNDHQGDDGGGPHLNQIARDGGEGHHPVLIDHGLGQVVSADLDGAGQQQGQQIEGEGLFLLGPKYSPLQTATNLLYSC